MEKKSGVAMDRRKKTRQRGKKKRIMKGKNGKDEMRRKKFKRESGVSGEKKGGKKTWSGRKKKGPDRS